MHAAVAYFDRGFGNQQGLVFSGPNRHPLGGSGEIASDADRAALEDEPTFGFVEANVDATEASIVKRGFGSTQANQLPVPLQKSSVRFAAQF